jgi:hypothetical protein
MYTVSGVMLVMDYPATVVSVDSPAMLHLLYAGIIFLCRAYISTVFENYVT